MKKIFLILIAILMASSLFSKQVTIIKKGGKLNKDGTVTYDYIKQQFTNGDLTYQHCLRRGHEKCPKVGIVTIGTGVSIDKYIELAEEVIAKNLEKGITTGKISYPSDNIMIYYKEASFVLDENGKETDKIEYHMTIEY